jgi:hypothetical protein
VIVDLYESDMVVMRPGRPAVGEPVVSFTPIAGSDRAGGDGVKTGVKTTVRACPRPTRRIVVPEGSRLVEPSWPTRLLVGGCPQLGRITAAAALSLALRRRAGFEPAEVIPPRPTQAALPLSFADSSLPPARPFKSPR